MSTMSTWDQFLFINLSFPTVIFSFFLILSLIYWSVAAFGLVDFDLAGPDTDLDLDVDGSADVGSVSGLLMKLGLNGVPIMLIITLVSFLGWLMTTLTSYYFLQHIPTDLLKIAFGAAVALVAFILSVFATAIVIKPIRPIFLEANQEGKLDLIGRTVTVRSGSVNEHFGEASFSEGGVDLILKVRSYADQTFAKGDRVVLIEHDKLANLYKVISVNEYQN